MENENNGGLLAFAGLIFLGTVAVKLGCKVGDEVGSWAVEKGKVAISKLTQKMKKEN